MNALLTALQYGDSGYPAGTFAHSFGLETAVEAGFVRGACDLQRAVHAILSQQAARTDAIAAAACARAAPGRDTASFRVIDQHLTATRAAREARLASVRIGRQMLETAAASEDDAWIDELRVLVAGRETDGNYASVAGAILGRLGGRPEDAAALVMWSTASGLMNAAVRLGTITYLESQRILTDVRALIGGLARSAGAADSSRFGGVVPLFEVLSMRHEVAETRLFAS